MSSLTANFKQEFNRVFRIKRLLLVIVVIVIIAIALNSGIYYYKSLLNKGKEFQDILCTTICFSPFCLYFFLFSYLDLFYNIHYNSNSILT
jgi:hypothetical protein